MPSVRSTARSMTFSSSRMLPGQLWRINTFDASGRMPSTFFFSSFANRLTKNSANAMKLLKAKLYQIEEQKQRAAVEKVYDEKGEVSWGRQIRNYVMQPYTLVKDTRTDIQSAQVNNVLDGDIDEFIQGYLRHKLELKSKAK